MGYERVVINSVPYALETVPGSARIKVSFAEGACIGFWDPNPKEPWPVREEGFETFIARTDSQQVLLALRGACEARKEAIGQLNECGDDFNEEDIVSKLKTDAEDEPSFVEIVDRREESSMVSSWVVYLCLCKGDTKRYRLFLGQYEPLAEASEYFNEDTEDYDLPTHIDGVEVNGIQDDYVVGGELKWVNDDETIEFDKASEPAVRAWLDGHEWWNETVAMHLSVLEAGPRH